MIALEILLVIFNWIVGYRWWSLIPLGVGFFLGAIFSANRVTNVFEYLWIDIITCVVLASMLGRAAIKMKKMLEENNIDYRIG